MALLSVITFILVLSILVMVHEGGHFLAAKKAGIRVEEFGFGYPPKIWGKKIKGTLYSLNAIPFGGFVRLYGEESEVDRQSDLAFYSKSKKARAGVILAGVVANFLLAIVCFTLVYSSVGIPTKVDQVKIIEVADNSPAKQAGLEENDQVLEVDDQPVKHIVDFTNLIKEKTGQSVELQLGRNGQSVIINVIPRENPPENEGALGVVISDTEMRKYPLWQMPFWGVKEGFKEALGWSGLIFNSLVMMVVNLVSKGLVPKDVAGPIGIYQATSQVAQNGWLSVVQFMGILSVNLAILNVMPIPAMDGGRLVFIVYELIARRKAKLKTEQLINTIGMGLLIVLIVLVTVNDIIRIIKTP